ALHTRVPWAAHSYNVAFSDEIGHFEYCSAVSQQGAGCDNESGQAGGDGDDFFCFAPPFTGVGPVGTKAKKIGGCLNSDEDFDGPSYRNDWPGTVSGRSATNRVGTPVAFTSPTFNSGQNYDRVAFETD